MPLDDDIDLDKLSDMTANYVGSDIENVSREAAMEALRRDIDSSIVSMDDFEDAIEKASPSAQEKDIKEFSKKVDKFESSGGKTQPDYFG
jgi:transitional endoplasmic reticulum ATPase